jgi:23S rRNA G2069 N7-methylase RlmK/C1962 C5-methylase RlmI
MPDAETAAKTAAQAEMLANRLGKRAKHLAKWAKRSGVEAYRIYDRDIPEIPLVLDRYGAYLVGALYERPYDKDPAEEALWIAAMRAAASNALGIDQERVLLKERKRQKGDEQYGRIAEERLEFAVAEGGLRFKVNVSDYLDTGLFLDHRLTRSLVRSESAGKLVLNLFSYTGAFSVYAAAGGAARVDSVDLSNTYLEWAAENFLLNGFASERIEPEAVCAGPAGLPSAGPHRLIRADALRFLAEAARSRLAWDLIVLDPPTFSNSKKMAGNLDVKRDYAELVDSALALLAPGGALYFSTNARGFKLDPAEFPSWIVRDYTARTVDEDFRGHSRRACYTFRR